MSYGGELWESLTQSYSHTCVFPPYSMCHPAPRPRCARNPRFRRLYRVFDHGRLVCSCWSDRLLHRLLADWTFSQITFGFFTYFHVSWKPFYCTTFGCLHKSDALEARGSTRGTSWFWAPSWAAPCWPALCAFPEPANVQIICIYIYIYIDAYKFIIFIFTIYGCIKKHLKPIL